MEDALQRLAKTIETGRLKDRNKMERRLGRIQAGHRQVSDLYDVAVRDTREGLRLQWSINEERQVWQGLREGAYMLRTNLQAGSAEELWSRYMQLTEAEASFRALKKRAVHSASVSSTGAARQGARDGCFPWLRSVGHSQTSAEAPGCHRPAAVHQRRHLHSHSLP